MNFFINNWYLIVLAAAVLSAAGYAIYVFVKRPRTEQLRAVKEWLLWAVTKAERELGSGTGKLKLRYVYDMFITKFPWLGKVVNFKMVSMMVDDALEKMRAMLESNEAVNAYVKGPSKMEAAREEK